MRQGKRFGKMWMERSEPPKVKKVEKKKQKYTENQQDMILAGHGRSQKLNVFDVNLVRILLDFGWTHQRIGDVMGVSKMCITGIKNGFKWSWLPNNAQLISIQ